MALHVEPTEQLTEDSMAQEVFKLIDSFHLSYGGKFNLLRAISGKIQERRGRPVTDIALVMKNKVFTIRRKEV